MVHNNFLDRSRHVTASRLSKPIPCHPKKKKTQEWVEGWGIRLDCGPGRGISACAYIFRWRLSIYLSVFYGSLGQTVRLGFFCAGPGALLLWRGFKLRARMKYIHSFSVSFFHSRRRRVWVDVYPPLRRTSGHQAPTLKALPPPPPPPPLPLPTYHHPNVCGTKPTASETPKPVLNVTPTFTLAPPPTLGFDYRSPRLRNRPGSCRHTYVVLLPPHATADLRNTKNHYHYCHHHHHHHHHQPPPPPPPPPPCHTEPLQTPLAHASASTFRHAYTLITSFPNPKAHGFSPSLSVARPFRACHALSIADNSTTAKALPLLRCLPY